MNARKLLLCYLALAFCLLSRAQSPGSIDIYAHFVGNWSGTDRYMDKGQYVTKPLSLEIKELSRSKGLLLVYRFGDGVRFPIEKPVKKVITLDPLLKKMTTQDQVLERLEFEAVGLDKFAQTGFGDFAARRTQLERGVVVMYVGRYHLTANELSWFWDRAEKGSDFVPYGEFHLQRDA